MIDQLSAFIVEDEIKAIELLKAYIKRINFLKLIGSERNPLTAFQFLQNNPVDILFLDINMPILSGIELLKSIKKKPKVIFTTAYPEFAVEGFDLEAVDYLLKPINFSRFVKACERLQKNLPHKDSRNLETLDLSDFVYVKSGVTTHKLAWREILYLEKDENYVIYHTAEKQILSRQTLSDLESIFPSYFCRIHKSYAISLLHIKQLDRESVSILDKRLPVGRTYKSRLKDAIG